MAKPCQKGNVRQVRVVWAQTRREAEGTHSYTRTHTSLIVIGKKPELVVSITSFPLCEGSTHISHKYILFTCMYRTLYGIDAIIWH